MSIIPGVLYIQHQRSRAGELGEGLMAYVTVIRQQRTYVTDCSVT